MNLHIYDCIYVIPEISFLLSMSNIFIFQVVSKQQCCMHLHLSKLAVYILQKL